MCSLGIKGSGNKGSGGLVSQKHINPWKSKALRTLRTFWENGVLEIQDLKQKHKTLGILRTGNMDHWKNISEYGVL